MIRRVQPLVVLPIAALAIHVATLHGYGWFRDEFYYVACARHLAWGYVDQPPFSIAVLRLVLDVAGLSLTAIRLVPALIAALTVLVIGLISRELGGRRFAQTLSMLAAIVAPEYLSLDFFYSMNAFDLLVWPVAALLLLRALRRPNLLPWVWLGVVLGVGLLNKISVLWLGGGIAAGLVATSWRRVLRTPGPWVAGAIAGVIFGPHVWWQMHFGWPTLEFIRNASADKMAVSTVPKFLIAQAMSLGPAVAILSAIGLVSAFLRRADARLILLGVAWLAVFALLATNGTSRAGYLAPAYSWLMAAGAIAVERWLASRSNAWRPVTVAVFVVTGVVLAPLALPILRVDRYVAYAAALHVRPSTEERKELAALPQFFADMHGWESIVSSVERAWQQLPADERDRAVFFGGNYGDAGAVTLLGEPRGMPAAFSGHNNYWFWGPPDDRIDAIVVMSRNPARLGALFTHVVEAGSTDCGQCMPYENHQPIYVCWGRKMSWADAWPRLKHYD